MSDKDLSEKNIERICNNERTRRLISQIIGKPPAKLVRPNMRPHTWVFLLRKDNRKMPITCLGIVFHTWDRAKYNMIRFTAPADNGIEVVASGRLTVLDNGETGIVLNERWPWTTLLKKFRGLSAGDL